MYEVDRNKQKCKPIRSPVENPSPGSELLLRTRYGRRQPDGSSGEKHL